MDIPLIKVKPMTKSKSGAFEVLILVDSGIGNALEALYAVEYCLGQNVKVGFSMNNISDSFQEYLRNCYPPGVILKSLENVTTNHLIHSFTFEVKIPITYENYFYVHPDNWSSYYQSETEQYLSIVKALFPGGEVGAFLKFLKADYSESVMKLDLTGKVVLYPGSSWFCPVKRWPYFLELEKRLSSENVIFVGGPDDVDISASYAYPGFIAKFFPQKLLNVPSFWSLLKKLGLLKPHAHNASLSSKNNAYMSIFHWDELVAIFQSCNYYVGNDGGLTHLAACSGADGLALFGPTSVLKNKPFSHRIITISSELHCSPCQFTVGGVSMAKTFINCPYEVKCLKSISVDEVLSHIKPIN